jgi:hypothetical protein
MAATINPSTISINDPVAATQGVTSFKLLVGTASGGPYTTSSAVIPVSAFTLNNGVYSCAFSAASFSPALSPFTVYFAVSEATSASGTSGGSPEASFQLETAPSAPTLLAFS